MSKHITMEMWSEAGSFDNIAVPGDTVDDEIAMHFLNCLPPVTMKTDYFQCGEPVSDVLTDKGWYAPTYSTFIRKKGVWTYYGNCLKGRLEHQPGSGDPWKP